MRRMIPQKDVDYIDQLKGTIHNGPGNEMVTIGDPDHGFILDGVDGWIQGERLDLGDPDGSYNGANISIDNSSNHSNITIYGPGNIVLDTEGDLVFTDNIYNIIIQHIPTSDPHVAGALWNDNGTLKISSGS